MIETKLSFCAFRALEELPQKIAFSIVRHLDYLVNNPRMGTTLSSRFIKLAEYRQLIVKREYRVIYEYDEFEECIYIHTIQNCRQKLPSPRDLKRKGQFED